MATLYLIRHGHALDADADEERPLSPKGKDQSRRLAKFFKHGHVAPPDEIWHSPLVRARETAEWVAEEAGWKALLQQVDGFTPDDSPWIAAKKLAAAKGTIAVFGHNPHLSLLSTLLVTGRSAPVAFVFHKTSALALDYAGEGPFGSWVVDWHIDPHLLRD